MHNRLTRICQWCERPFFGNRKFCSSECRHEALESKTTDPTPEEIRDMCRLIREEGGPAWERSRSCYLPEPVRMRVVAARHYCLSLADE